MGNRAVVAFDKFDDNALGVYFHWNGGRDSIEAILKATRKLMDDRLGDESYGRARFIQCATAVLPGNLSLGLAHCKELDTDNGNNGTYVVNSETMEITERLFFSGAEQTEHNVDEFAEEITTAINKMEGVE